MPRLARSPTNLQAGYSRDNRHRIAGQEDHQKEDPGAMPILLSQFERPCSNNFSQRRQDADVAARGPTDSKSERGATGRTLGLDRNQSSGLRESWRSAASVLASVEMTTFTEADEAPLAWIGEEDEGGGGSERRGRLGRRQSRRQWVGRGSVHRGLVQPGRCTTDLDEMAKDCLISAVSQITADHLLF